MLTIVTQQAEEEIPCGGCRHTMPSATYWRGLIFNHFHELPPEIREGKVNFRRCQRCGFGGMLWPGFLCFDRMRNRLVSVVYSREPHSSARSLLQETLEYCVAKEPDFSRADLERRHITVENYRDVLEKLTHDEGLFAAEAHYAELFRQRALEGDLATRARMLLDSVTEGSLILFEGAESELSFRTELLRQAEADAKIYPAETEQYRRARFFLDSADKILRKAGPAPTASATRLPEPDAPVPADAKIFDVQINAQVAQMVAAVLREWKPADGHQAEGEEWFSSVAGLAGMQSFCTPLSMGPRPGRLRTERIRSAAGILVGHLPKMEFSFEDEGAPSARVNTEEMVWLAVDGWRPAQSAVQNLVFALANRRGDTASMKAAISFFASMAAEFGDFDCLTYACTGAIYILEQAGAGRDAVGWVAAIAADAHARLVQHSTTTIGVHSDVSLALAIIWQRIARSGLALDRPYMSSLCSAVSIEFATVAGRPDGVFSSRGDVLEAMFFMGHDIRPEVERLVADLRAYLASDGTDDRERQPLLALAKRALLLGIRREFGSVRKDLAILEMKVPEPTEGQLDRIPLIVDTSTRIFGRASGHKPADSGAGAGAGEESDTEEASADAKPVCVILLATGPSAARRAITARFSNCRWFDAFAEVLDLDAELGSQSILETYMVLLELVETLEHPELSAYFLDCIRAEASTAAFEPDQSAHFRLFECQARLAQWQSSGRSEGDLTAMRGAVADLTRDFKERDSGIGDVRTSNFAVASTLVALAEMNESVGLHAEAADQFAEAALLQLAARRHNALAALEKTDNLQAITPIYRAARAIAKAARDGDPLLGPRALELAELCKAISQVPRDKVAVPEPDAEAAVGSSLDHLLARVPVRLEELQAYYPSGSAILFQALLHQTQLNEGFWLTALILPGSPSGVHIRQLAFDEVHGPYERLEKLMEKARRDVTNATLAEAAERLLGDSADVDRALEDLGDALMPPEWMALIEQHRIDRLFIVPESYLHDLPWAAVRVDASKGRMHLGQSAAGAGIALSIIPSIAFLAETRRREERELSQPLQVLAAASVPWRHDLDPIYGIEPRLHRIVEAVGDGAPESESIIVSGAGVLDLIKTLRTARVAVFFGHGEVTEAGATLLASDGFVGEAEVVAAHGMRRFRSEVALLMACSGVSSTRPGLGREVTGCHMALVRGGVGCVVGSSKPLFPPAALLATETMLPLILAGRATDEALGEARNHISSTQHMKHPLFWAYLACFGDGFRAEGAAAQ